jgi:hypothetical protein
MSRKSRRKQNALRDQAQALCRLSEMPPEIVWAIIRHLGFYHYALALGLTCRRMAEVVFCWRGSVREQGWASRQLAGRLDASFCSPGWVPHPFAFGRSLRRPETTYRLAKGFPGRLRLWDVLCLSRRAELLEARPEADRQTWQWDLSPKMIMFGNAMLDQGATLWLLARGLGPIYNNEHVPRQVFSNLCRLRAINPSMFVAIKAWYGNCRPVLEEDSWVRCFPPYLYKKWYVPPQRITSWRAWIRERFPEIELPEIYLARDEEAWAYWGFDVDGSWWGRQLRILLREKQAPPEALAEALAKALPEALPEALAALPTPAELAHRRAPTRIRRPRRPDRSRWGAPRPRRVFAGGT